MSWSYHNHLYASRGRNNEMLGFCPSRVTYVTFDQWLALYHGDPDHWTDLENFYLGALCEEHWYHLPMYRKIVRYDNEYIYIKFLTKKDFKKYKRYIKTLQNKGQDFENLKELEELTKFIGNIANERLKETQRKTQQAIDENEKLMKEARLMLHHELEGRKIELSL